MSSEEASSSGVLDSLSGEQKQILLNYQAITGAQDLTGAAATLEAFAWDLETAVQDFFDGSSGGGTASRSQPSVPSASSSSSQRRQQQEQQQDDSVPLLPTASSVASAPDEPQRIRGNVQRPTPTLIALFTTPLQWGFKLLWTIFSFALGLLPFLGLGRRHRRRGGSTSDNSSRSSAESPAARFKEDFVASYGSRHPAFFQGTYTQALESAKRDIRYFLAILHSEEHDDTPAFCRETLASDAFINFLSEKNVVVWGGNIKESEAFKVSTVLGATAYPFMAIIALQGSRMVVLHRFEGLLSTEHIINKLRRLMDRFDPQLAGARADRASRDSARLIREQQDAAYQESLRADREKARRAQEEQERQRREQEELERQERERLERIERRKQRKIEIAAALPAEPAATDSDLAKLGIRLPNGQRLIRRFRADDTVQLLCDFIETHDLSPLDLETDFVVVTPFPRKVFRDMSQTLRAAGLYPNASIVVEERIDDDL